MRKVIHRFSLKQLAHGQGFGPFAGLHLSLVVSFGLHRLAGECRREPRCICVPPRKSSTSLGSARPRIKKAFRRAARRPRFQVLPALLEPSEHRGHHDLEHVGRNARRSWSFLLRLVLRRLLPSSLLPNQSLQLTAPGVRSPACKPVEAWAAAAEAGR